MAKALAEDEALAEDKASAEEEGNGASTIYKVTQVGCILICSNLFLYRLFKGGRTEVLYDDARFVKAKLSKMLSLQF